jgi:hypothetical protein
MHFHPQVLAFLDGAQADADRSEPDRIAFFPDQSAGASE